ncbi:MAG: fructose-bisphosphate aldolase class I [Candidatus Magasanikbacteria bacterium]|nr:fructose-bisphosphate aldolase class I [Candidatus Magasanikbacteria bacterium]
MIDNLESIAKVLIASHKGILAADESTNTITKRFDVLGIESTEETRRQYREMLFTTAGIENYISGVILFDETIRQETEDGVSFVDVLKEKGIIPGIKVDQGKEAMQSSPEEMITKGLDSLAKRLQEYYKFGARFAKWRAVIKISEKLPTEECIEKNMSDLAQYAKICQENDFVPIVEPEVLRDGSHGIDRCYEVTKKVLEKLFEKLSEAGVDLKGILLKPNMITPGEASEEEMDPEIIAEKTVECFKAVVPEVVPGVVFLSGGQTEAQACENLNAMNKNYTDLPWQLSFSYGRALQNSAMRTWNGKDENVGEAQEVFLNRAKLVSAGREGKYSIEI